jgi:hypothetical protein
MTAIILSLNKGQQVLVNCLRFSSRHPMREARVRDQFAVL